MKLYYINISSGKKVFYTVTINEVFKKNKEYCMKEKGFWGSTHLLNLINFHSKEVGCVVVLKRL